MSKELDLPTEYQTALLACLDKKGNFHVDMNGDLAPSKTIHVVAGILCALRRASEKNGLEEKDFWRIMKDSTDFLEEHAEYKDIHRKEE